MPNKTLAACVMAAIFVSALLAQSQDTTLQYTYRGADSPPKVDVPKNPAITACDSNSQAPADEALDHANQAIKAKAMPTGICWLNVAAAQKIGIAYGALAAIYFKGTGGVPVDLEKALYFAIKAAEGHDSTGETIISRMYESGRAVPKDLEEAAYWKKRAAKDKAAEDASYALARQPSTQPAYGPNGPTPNPQTTPSNAPVPIPDVMHFCAQHCLTFTRASDNELVNGTNLPGQYNEKRVLKVEKFTPDSVIIHRTDYGSYPGRGIMTGSMQYGNNMASGQNWQLSWGQALDTLPASDEERAMRAGGLPQQQISAPQQNAESFFLLMLLGAALLGDSGPDATTADHSAAGSANRYQEYKSGCAAGYSSACARIGEPTPLGKP